jgi:anti-anti-sigma factor
MSHDIYERTRPDCRDYRTILTLQHGKVKDDANRLAGRFDNRAAEPSGPVLLDFRNVEHVISEDLGALIGLHNRVKREGGRLTLVNVRPLVSNVLAITRLDTLFDVHNIADAPMVGGPGR